MNYLPPLESVLKAYGMGLFPMADGAGADEILALAVVGLPAALYVGSWSNWITDPARPVATGR